MVGLFRYQPRQVMNYVLGEESTPLAAWPQGVTRQGRTPRLALTIRASLAGNPRGFFGVLVFFFGHRSLLNGGGTFPPPLPTGGVARVSGGMIKPNAQFRCTGLCVTIRGRVFTPETDTGADACSRSVSGENQAFWHLRQYDVRRFWYS